jgi:hypothetical protein
MAEYSSTDSFDTKSVIFERNKMMIELTWTQTGFIVGILLTLFLGLMLYPIIRYSSRKGTSSKNKEYLWNYI